MKISFSNLNLRRKIGISIILVSIIPLILIFFGLYYKQPISGWSIVFCVFAVLLGWWVVFEVIASVVKVYLHSKDTLKDVGASAPVIPDEVQSLETVINLLSDKVKGSFEQMKDFTQKTEQLNKEISKKVLILSTILQANDLFSKEAPVEEVIKFLSYHLRQFLELDICFCVLKDNITYQLSGITYLGINLPEVNSFMETLNQRLSNINKLLILGKGKELNPFLPWVKEMSIKNMAIVPIVSRDQTVGVVGVGSRESTSGLSKDDLDVLNLFAQNITLIWEHRRLSSRVADLEIFDSLTGLYNEKAIIEKLNEEIQRAKTYQRACGFVSVEVLNYTEYQKEFGVIELEKILKKIAKVFKESLRNIDLAGRIGPNKLAAILIESNKRKSQEIVKKLQLSLKEVCADKVKLAFSAASSPLDGITADELLQFSQA